MGYIPMIQNNIGLSTDSNSREILERPVNRQLMDLLLPGVFENLMFTGSTLHLSRSSNRFDGTSESGIDSISNIAKAVILNDTDKFVFQSKYSEGGVGYSLYENGTKIPDFEDKPFPINCEELIQVPTMCNILTNFINSTLGTLDTLPISTGLREPAFRFTSNKSNSGHPVEHIATLGTFPGYWHS